MPPASPDTTLAWRSASSSEVLPWSTWPITVTTGERGSVSVESSTTSNRPSSTSDAATRLTVWPISSAISCAVSASITSVILCIAPCFISRRMTSTARSDMRLASSWMVIASGIITSRMSFSFGSLAACPFRRWVRRRNEAIERSRTSSALSAVTSVRRPRSFCGPGLWVVLGGMTGRMAPPGPRRIWRGPSSSSEPSAATPGRARAARLPDGRRPGGPRRVARQRAPSLRSWLRPRQIASWPRLRPCAWLPLPGGAVLPRPCGGLRRLRARPVRCLRGWRGAWLLPRPAGVPRLRGPWRRPARWRGRNARPRSACAAPRRNRRAARPALPRGGRAGPWRAGAALATTGSGACVSVAGASPPTRRLPRFSTTTCLVRPWLKLWRTVPVSTRGLSVKVLVGTLKVLSPGVLVSTIQQS